MNGPLKIDRQQIEWRRNQTLELSSAWQITKRDINHTASIRSNNLIDMKLIRQQAQKAIEQHIQNDLPLQHQKAMSGLHQVLKDGVGYEYRRA